jgi:hypothetical protein
MAALERDHPPNPPAASDGVASGIALDAWLNR